MNPPCRIVTFYSYKGGTGRSMAMANVAWILAVSGFKVLAIDWDLEAPGLHRYFRPFLDDPELAEADGVIDFVIHLAEIASEQVDTLEADGDKDWFQPYANLLPYAIELNYPFPNGGTLDFIPAGRQDSAYAIRVNSFNWKHFYQKLDGSRILDQVRDVLRDEYDFVLIDSRTGVSDTAGICTVQMPDDLVVGFTLNLQAVIGASSTSRSILEQRIARNIPIRIFPVAMRVDVSEKIKTDIMKAYAKPRFLPVLPPEMNDKEKDRYWSESDVPYIPFYAFEENLAYFRDEQYSPRAVLPAMKLIAQRLSGRIFEELTVVDEEMRRQVVEAYDAFAGPKAASQLPASTRSLPVPQTPSRVFKVAESASEAPSESKVTERPPIAGSMAVKLGMVTLVALILGLGGLAWSMHKITSTPANMPAITNAPMAPPDGVVTHPNELPAVDTKGTDIKKQCASVTVSLYVNSIENSSTRKALSTLWTGEYGMYLQSLSIGSRQQRANGVWHSPDVPDVCWQDVAFSLIRAGFSVSDLGAPEKNTNGKGPSIEVGYSVRALGLPALTIGQVSSPKP